MIQNFRKFLIHSGRRTCFFHGYCILILLKSKFTLVKATFQFMIWKPKVMIYYVNEFVLFGTQHLKCRNVHHQEKCLIHDWTQSWIIRIWPLSPSCVPVLFCTASSCPAIFIMFHRLLHNRICIFMIDLKICTVSNKFCVKLPQLSRLLKIIADINSWMNSETKQQFSVHNVQAQGWCIRSGACLGTSLTRSVHSELFPKGQAANSFNLSGSPFWHKWWKQADSSRI